MPRRCLALAALAVLVSIASPAAHAKSCGDVVVGSGRSALRLGDRAGERRARHNAILDWSARVGASYGWSYRFWRRSAQKAITCSTQGGAQACSVSAKPCRLW